MKVHVLCPASSVTGGPEALHQLVDAGQRLGYDMAMLYLPEDDPDPTPAVFRMYQPRVVKEIVDSPDSVVVVPETGTLQLLELKHATRALWWLSVEHYFSRAEALRRGAARSPLDFVFDPRFEIVHLAQSEYARQWVAARGSSALMLTDFIRDEILDRSRALRGGARQNIVAYNPKKGLAFTQQLMAASPPEVQWVAIENMSPAEVAQLLGRAKVYVDFGPHPGRDRIPREAALCGCVVITNTQGSAGNAVDVPLPEGYKFDERHPLTVPLVIQRIAEAMADHATHAQRLAPYVQWIEDQRRLFTEEVFTFLATVEARQRARLRDGLPA
ncbi:hypothetical protein KAK07_21610 [Ideonella sp. 4Y16]|uniref:hypothetical protein n=1 Tax=Ideonella alba TaxID=2824118 RepID=UPI001B3808B7|nr:hypothetical protein [Ideonella alba]MBQ0945953.1 hypothetical protein [Ideonella alba]